MNTKILGEYHVEMFFFVVVVVYFDFGTSAYHPRNTNLTVKHGGGGIIFITSDQVTGLRTKKFNPTLPEPVHLMSLSPI